MSEKRLFYAYLLKPLHVCEGFIKKKIFATKTPRHEVFYNIFFLCVLVALWLFPVYPGWVLSVIC